jgi:hypothetical protein
MMRAPQSPALKSGGLNQASLLNAILFQLNWFACVLGGANGQLLWPAITLMLMFAQIARGSHVRGDLVLALMACLIGLFLDSLWIRLGILDFGTAWAPVWIVMMWAGAALSINHSLSWLQSQPVLGGVLAAMVAPLCYLSGESLGAVTTDSAGLLLVACSWLVVFTLAFRFARGRTA